MRGNEVSAVSWRRRILLLPSASADAQGLPVSIASGDTHRLTSPRPRGPDVKARSRRGTWSCTGRLSKFPLFFIVRGVQTSRESNPDAQGAAFMHQPIVVDLDTATLRPHFCDIDSTICAVSLSWLEFGRWVFLLAPSKNAFTCAIETDAAAWRALLRSADARALPRSLATLERGSPSPHAEPPLDHLLLARRRVFIPLGLFLRFRLIPASAGDPIGDLDEFASCDLSSPIASQRDRLLRDLSPADFATGCPSAWRFPDVVRDRALTARARCESSC